jgi:hypothetical protein
MEGRTRNIAKWKSACLACVGLGCITSTRKNGKETKKGKGKGKERKGKDRKGKKI